MSITEQFRSVWRFLSLDMVRPFYEELWIQIQQPDRLQQMLREHLLAVIEASSSEAARIHVELVASFQKIYGLDAWRAILLWSDHVLDYGFEGSDRFDEYIWMMQVRELARTEYVRDASDHVQKALEEIVQLHR